MTSRSSPAPSVAPDRTLDDLVGGRLAGAAAALAALEPLRPQIAAAALLVRRVVADGGLVATIGNGGSAAEALHLAEELVGRYRSVRPPIRAACLAADPTALTCIGNDYGFEQVFARQAEALLRAGDLLVVFSTSGSSPNLLAAIEAAHRRGASVLGLLGRDGGRCAAGCDCAVVVPVADSGHIQEAHQVLLHILCEALEPAGEDDGPSRSRRE